MSYIVKVGTKEAQWNCSESIPSGFVEFTGQLTDTLIWDSALNNLREKTADELRLDTCAAINELIDAERNRREQDVFTYQGKQIQCDKDSIARMSVAALNALSATLTNATFSINWLCVDNTHLALDSAGMLSMMAALGMQGAALHYHARALKDQVAAATDPESIDIYAGWPV